VLKFNSCECKLHSLLHSWVPKSHSACRNHSCACWNQIGRPLSRIVVPLVYFFIFVFVRVEITVVNVSCACWNHSRKCHNYIWEITLCIWKSHSACINHTLRVEITVVSQLHCTLAIACSNYTQRVEISLCVYKSHSCVLKSHYAFRNYTCTCEHHTMRVNITLCRDSRNYICAR
jgi:hypothetical protein